MYMTLALTTHHAFHHILLVDPPSDYDTGSKYVERGGSAERDEDDKVCIVFQKSSEECVYTYKYSYMYANFGVPLYTYIL